MCFQLPLNPAWPLSQDYMYLNGQLNMIDGIPSDAFPETLCAISCAITIKGPLTRHSANKVLPNCSMNAFLFYRGEGGRGGWRVCPYFSVSQMAIRATSLPLSKLSQSHCSDNENNNDHDAKRTHSIGWIALRTYSTNRGCAFVLKWSLSFSLSLQYDWPFTVVVFLICVW